MDEPMALLPHATVHRVIHSTEGVIVLTVTQECMYCCFSIQLRTYKG